MPFASGELLLWTSPLTPFFGREEMEMLRSTTVLLALALERADTLERERRASERLRELNELKDTFLSAVSHELRTPLTAILGFAMTLEQRFDELAPDRARGLARELVTAAERLEGMLADLLDLDRLRRGVLEPRLEEVDVAALAQRTVEAMTLDRRPIVEAEPAVAAVDVAKVERIIENLVYNAYKHTPPGTRVWLSVKALDDGVQLTVADEGPGVPEELRQRIFEPFERGDLAHAPGSGIGLSLVTRFAALHRGRSWVEERVGGGAAFHVFLPQNSPPVTAHRRLLPAR
jgi:two-component system sensor histidine kinase KdpD